MMISQTICFQGSSIPPPLLGLIDTDVQCIVKVSISGTGEHSAPRSVWGTLDELVVAIMCVVGDVLVGVKLLAWVIPPAVISLDIFTYNVQNTDHHNL